MATGDRPAGSLTATLAAWAAQLRYADLPEHVAVVAVSQVVSQLAAVRTGLSHPLGQKVVKAFGPPTGGDPKRAAYVQAALSSCLYVDDTVFAGHVSHAAVGVPLAYLDEQRPDGRSLLATVVAANECAARVTAASTLGPFRGKSASCTHLVGAVAARLHGARADWPLWQAAWGLALAAPPYSLRRAFIGSEAGALSAAVPIRTGLDACDAAEAGFLAADDILEHPDGFLAAFAAVPIPEHVTTGLGERWHTETMSFKVHPAGVHVDAIVDCALELRAQLWPGGVPAADDIAEIVVVAPQLTVGIESVASKYLAGEATPITALNFTVGYNLATALLTGGLTVDDLHGPALADPARWALAAKVKLCEDEAMSRTAMTATAPVGEALRQAGENAVQWRTILSGIPLADLARDAGEPHDSYEGANKLIGARLVVRTTDGRELTAARESGLGAAGPYVRRHHAEIARAKLAATGVGADVLDGLARLPELGPDELAELTRVALAG